MKTATVNLTVSVAGDGENSQGIPVAAWQSQNSPGSSYSVNVPIGDYTVAPPLTAPIAGYAIVTFPAGPVAVLKGSAGDAGINMGSLGGTIQIVLNQVFPSNSFIINFSVACTIRVRLV